MHMCVYFMWVYIYITLHGTVLLKSWYCYICWITLTRHRNTDRFPVTLVWNAGSIHRAENGVVY